MLRHMPPTRRLLPRFLQLADAQVIDPVGSMRYDIPLQHVGGVGEYGDEGTRDREDRDTADAAREEKPRKQSFAPRAVCIACWNAEQDILASSTPTSVSGVLQRYRIEEL